MVVGKVEVISFVFENHTYQFYPAKPRTAIKSCSEMVMVVCLVQAEQCEAIEGQKGARKVMNSVKTFAFFIKSCVGLIIDQNYSFTKLSNNYD